MAGQLNDGVERLRPVLISVIENYGDSPDQAVEMILRLLDAPMAAPAQGAAPSQDKSASSQAPKHRARAPRAPPPLSPDARPLTPFEWYSLAEVEAFLGVKSQSVRNLINENPEILITRRRAPEAGASERTEVQGRGIIMMRERRDRAARGESPSTEAGGPAFVGTES